VIAPTPDVAAARNPGAIVALALGVVLLTVAVSVDLPKTALGFKGDEATYYSLTHSLARDFDFAFDHGDLMRVWEEYPGGPEGIFLKRGKTIHIRRSHYFPFVHWTKLDDPVRTHLYYSKSFIYPLVAAPFVFAFGTNGFLVLHALLFSLDLFLVYTFIAARGSPPAAAAAFALVFLFASVVPLYFVWLTPELFNFSLALYALFLWSYKELAIESPRSGDGAFLRGRGSDYAAATLIGVLIFSKPTHAILMLPLVALAASRRQWRHAVRIVMTCALVAGGFFAANAAITGEFNYQGGDRKTFYGPTGFPFANDWETFESIGAVHGRDTVMVGDVLVNRHSLTVFRHNLWYFIVGRSGGLVPYFFPGVLSALLFVVRGRRRLWQWLACATIAAAIVVLLVVWPFTYSGGGGPVGNRYFLSFYPLFLLLTPPLAGLASAGVALAVGALFTAKILLNPFYSSFNPGEHMKSGPLRWLPMELTLLNDLPVAAKPDRMKRPLGGEPPVLAYFPDDNAYDREDDGWFWVRGKSRAEVILRAPVVDIGEGRVVTKTISRLGIEIQNGANPDRVTVSTGRESRTLDMKPAEVAHLNMAVDGGVPYRRDEQATSYVYTMSIRTTSGFVPFLLVAGQSDARFLGARIHIVPQYADAETSTWTAKDK
jgi:hypothetical protein